MVSSNGARRKTSRPERAEDPARTREQAAATAVATASPPARRPAVDAPEPRRQSRRPQPPRIGPRRAAAAIRGLGEETATPAVRTSLRRLAALVTRGAGDARRLALAEAAIGECLDEAAGSGDRWLLCEAAAWALGWMARTRRAGGSAGGLLERLVREARTAETALAGRDTAPARFVLTISRLFCDIEACRCLEAGAAAALVEEIDRLVADQGVVGLVGSATVIRRVVRWTTARDLAVATGGPCWAAATEARWREAVLHALRLLGGQGRMVVEAGRMPASFTEPLLEAAAAMRAKRPRRTAAVLRKGRRAGGDDQGLLSLQLHAAAAATTVVRSTWHRDGLRVMLDHRDATPRIEIAVDDRMLVEGPWQWSVTKGGRPLEVEGAWEVSCWESDRKATFLELVAPLAGGMQLERELVVLPRERIVVLADAVRPRPEAGPTTAPGGGPVLEPLGYRGIVPLAASLEAEAAEETREVVVYDTAMRFMALPLAAPEWRAAPGGGLAVVPEGLALEQSGGGRLYAPLWLDCDAARVGGPLTWRQLTVADTRRNLPPHQAAGFRVQAGLEQWLLYRALDQPRNRTLLGCNVSCEFLLGRIRKSGEVARTIEIE